MAISQHFLPNPRSFLSLEKTCKEYASPEEKMTMGVLEVRSTETSSSTAKEKQPNRFEQVLEKKSSLSLTRG